MNTNKRMETLKANGIDTSKYFTLLTNEDIPAGTKINIALDIQENDPIATQIIEDGYVRNTKLYRRFVAAQYMRMLNSPLGWHGYLNAHYGYMYQFDMMLEEVRVLTKLRKRDWEAFSERSVFFTREVVRTVLHDYLTDVEKNLGTLPVKHCKGNPYIKVKGVGNVFIDELDEKIINPIKAIIGVYDRAYTYDDWYEALKMFKKVMIPLPHEARKSKAWVDAFQKAGAYYTLKNLIMFHEVDLYYNRYFHRRDDALNILRTLRAKYEGYQMNALLKETIKRNDFDLKRSIEEHK